MIVRYLGLFHLPLWHAHRLTLISDSSRTQMPMRLKIRITNTVHTIQCEPILLDQAKPLELKIIKILRDSMRLLNLELIVEASSKLGKLKFGSRNGLTTQPSMAWATISPTMPLVFSSMTQQKLYWTLMDIILIIWREDQVIVKTSAKNTLLPNTQKNCKRK